MIIAGHYFILNFVFVFDVDVELIQKWKNVMVNPIGNWWESLKHSIAWRLLEVAKNGDYHERVKAVRQLSRIDHLKGNKHMTIYIINYESM